MIYNLRATSPSLIIVLITFVGFILQQIYPDIALQFMLNKGDLFEKPYSILTHMFLHANFPHILFNMFGVLIFGSLLEQRLKNYQYYALYFGSGILAGIIGSFIYDAALGASAGVMALVGASAMLYPKVVFYIFGVFPLQLRTLAFIYFIYDFLGSFTMNNVANLAHIIGMVSGLSYAYFLLTKNQLKKYKGARHIEAHLKGNNRDPEKVVIVHSLKKSKSKLNESDFSKGLYVSADESKDYLNRNK